MAERLDIPNFEIEEGERLMIEASVTGSELTWAVRLRIGKLSAFGHITQATINNAALDAPRIFMELLRLKIDKL